MRRRSRCPAPGRSRGTRRRAGRRRSRCRGRCRSPRRRGWGRECCGRPDRLRDPSALRRPAGRTRGPDRPCLLRSRGRRRHACRPRPGRPPPSPPPAGRTRGPGRGRSSGSRSPARRRCGRPPRPRSPPRRRCRSRAPDRPDAGLRIRPARGREGRRGRGGHGRGRPGCARRPGPGSSYPLVLPGVAAAVVDVSSRRPRGRRAGRRNRPGRRRGGCRRRNRPARRRGGRRRRAGLAGVPPGVVGVSVPAVVPGVASCTAPRSSSVAPPDEWSRMACSYEAYSPRAGRLRPRHPGAVRVDLSGVGGVVAPGAGRVVVPLVGRLAEHGVEDPLADAAVLPRGRRRGGGARVGWSSRVLLGPGAPGPVGSVAGPVAPARRAGRAGRPCAVGGSVAPSTSPDRRVGSRVVGPDVAAVVAVVVTRAGPGVAGVAVVVVAQKGVDQRPVRGQRPCAGARCRPRRRRRGPSGPRGSAARPAGGRPRGRRPAGRSRRRPGSHGRA